MLSLLHIPVLKWFAEGNYFGESHWIMHGMLANLGYSKTECVSSSMILGATLNLKCNAGSMQLVDWGVVTHLEESLQCLRKSDNECAGYLADQAFHSAFDKSCKGNKSCQLKSLSSTFVRDDGSAVARWCMEANSRLFVQYMCK